MNRPTLRIATFNKKELATLMDSDWFARSAHIPISRIRAESQLRNPRLREADILLAIVYDGETMVGYLGVLPDTVFEKNGSAHHCGWLSCLWVDEKRRGAGIAKLLLSTVMDGWDDQILITSFTEEAGELYKRSGRFGEVFLKKGIRLYLRFDLQHILKPKLGRWSFLMPAISVLDSVLNAIGDLRFRMNGEAVENWKRVSISDLRVQHFIESQLPETLTQRGVKELQWLEEHPWLVAGAATEVSERYYFSSVVRQLEQRVMGYFEGEELKAVVMFLVRDGSVTVPYYFGNCDTEAATFIVETMKQEHWKTLTVFDEKLMVPLRQINDFIYRRAQWRPFVMSKKLAARFAEMPEMRFAAGDGDAAFT